MMLNVKTSYSLLESLINIDDLILFAKNNNLKTLSIVDNNMYSFMEFYTKCNNNNIKPIFGFRINNIVLFPKNYDGYLNLLKINSHVEEKTFTEDVLNKYKDNIIIVSEDYKFNIDHNDLYYGFSNLDELKNLFDKEVIFFKQVSYLLEDDINSFKNLLKISDKEYKSETYYLLNNLNKYSSKEGLLNVEKIVDSINIIINKQSVNLPKYKDDVSSDEYLYKLSTIGLSRRLNGNVTEVYKYRLKHELETIISMKYSDYFLIVYDFIKHAKVNNILVGPGRGSAAGSLVAYSLGITDVDPIKYDLLFERFLNKDRNTMPDIDTDFPDNKREEVIKYVEEKYNKKNVSRIITFNTFGYKNAFRELKDVLNIPSYKIEDLLNLTKNSNLKLKDIYNTNNRFKLMINDDIKLKELYNTSLLIENIPRSISKHPAGIIISSDELDNYVPLIKVNDEYLSGYSMNYLEDLGLLKMDFLGLKNLTWIDNLIKEINEKENLELSFNNIPLFDYKTNELFSMGLTDGIFQFESLGMKNMLRKIKPSSFEEIYTSIALYRPGAIDEIDTYIYNKNNKDNIKYMHKSLKDILKDTYGVIVFQEQIMNILRKVASYDLKEADNIRRAISKKDIKGFEKIKDSFIKNGLKNNYDLDTLNDIYDKLIQFASYGFAKSHAVSYSIISYRMAYLKANYPMYFYKMLLNNTIKNINKTKEYIFEAKKLNVEVQRPDVNISSNVYEIKDNNLYYPLTNLHEVSNNLSLNIKENQDKDLDVFNLVKYVDINLLNKESLNSLIVSSSVKSSKYNMKTLITNIDLIINYSELSNELGDVLEPVLNIEADYDRLEKLSLEKGVFGFYFNNHPATIYKHEEKSIVNISDVKNHFNKRINLIGVITNIHKITTKNNEEMAFVKIEDETGFIDTVLFPKSFNKYKDIEVNNVVKLTGNVERREDKYQLIINNLYKF